MMSQLVLPGDTFHILEAKVKGAHEHSIHVGMNTGVSMIHDYIQKDVPTGDITLYKVTIKPNELAAQQVPWSTIAVELIKVTKK